MRTLLVFLANRMRVTTLSKISKLFGVYYTVHNGKVTNIYR